jgi:hypothetical protein
MVALKSNARQLQTTMRFRSMKWTRRRKRAQSFGGLAGDLINQEFFKT